MAVSAYRISDPPVPSIQVAWVERVSYDATMGRGFDEWELVVLAFVCDLSDVGGQQRLDRMLDSSGGESVKAALESDKTLGLGGVVSGLRVTRSDGYQQYQLPAGSVLGAAWYINLFASGR
jgi:hypothetical protein